MLSQSTFHWLVILNSSSVYAHLLGEIEEMAIVLYSSAIGSLIYAMVCTRPGIAHAVGVVSRIFCNSRKEHYEVVKWICKSYVCAVGELIQSWRVILIWINGRKSTSGNIFTLAGGAISWQSKLRKCVALSTTKVE